MTYRDMLAVLARVANDPLMAQSRAAVIATTRRMVMAILVSEIVLVIQPYPVKWYFDGLTKAWPPILVYTLCAGMLALYFVGTDLHSRQASLRWRFYFENWCALWGYAHLKELKLDTAWHVQHSTGDKESIVARNVIKVLDLLDELLSHTIPGVMRIGLIAIAVWWLGLHIGGVALVTIVGFVLAMLRTERIIGPFRKRSHAEGRHLEREGTEMTKTWRTLKQMGIEDDACFRHWDHMREYVLHETEKNVVFNGCWKRQEYMVNVGRVMLYAACYHWYDPAAGLGSVVLATAWMERIFSNLYRLESFQQRLNRGREAAAELCEIFNIVPVVRQPEHPLWPADGVRGAFELDAVSFSFPNRDDETLKDLNLRVRPNECLALIGKTGSGKTTLTSLLLREYPPTSGRILLDGIPLDQLDHDRYRREAVSVVSQKFDLFDGTILENILKANPTATLEEAQHAARQAHAHEFIVRLPRGYDSRIGEDGIQLSGGQRQRLAIARALVRKPRILILDEATSSLDGESQAEVQRAIDQLIVERQATIIVIAHRLSTIRRADRIVVLETGHITGVGTHAELYRENARYRSLMDRERASLEIC